MNIKLRFDKAIEYMVAVNHYLAAELSKLGYPIACDDIPTAGVGWDNDRKKIQFLFNPKFAEKLTDEEFAFVVGHECIHLLHSHVFLLRDEVERLKKIQKSPMEIMQYQRKMNIAMDCVVNDSLTNLYDLPKVLTEITPDKPKIFYGKETVGTDCHDMTAKDVFMLLPEPPPQPGQGKDQQGQGGQPGQGTGGQGQGDVENHNQWQSFFNQDGTLNKNFVDTIKEFVQKNKQNSNLSDAEAETVDDMQQQMKNSTDAYAAKAGREAVGALRPIDGLSRETINWNKILYKFVETRKPEDIWTKPNRKLISVYPDAILPSWKDEEKEKIFVAVDSSGSISREALSLFVSVLKNTPKRFEIDAISFDTRCYEYNVKGKEFPKGGGGTNFQIIEDYIQKHFKKYPKAIFVLTDGEGTNVKPQYPDRWGWLLYGPCQTYFCKNMRYYKIFDLLEKNAKI